MSDDALEDGALVDVIGYPGLYNDFYVRNMHHMTVDIDMLESIFALLPRCRLVVSCGPLLSSGIMPKYRVSTVRGMSGAPVISDGKAVGKFPTLSSSHG